MQPRWTMDELDAAIAARELKLSCEEIAVYVQDKCQTEYLRSAQSIRSKLAYQGVSTKESYPTKLDSDISQMVHAIASTHGIAPKSVLIRAYYTYQKKGAFR